MLGFMLGFTLDLCWTYAGICWIYARLILGLLLALCWNYAGEKKGDNCSGVLFFDLWRTYKPPESKLGIRPLALGLDMATFYGCMGHHDRQDIDAGWEIL